MSVAVIGADEHLGEILCSRFGSTELDLVTLPRDWSGDATARMLRAGVQLSIYVGHFPEPVSNGPPIWLDVFTRNALGANRALTQSLPALRAAPLGKFVVVADTPLRQFPEFSFVRGQGTVERVRESAIVACANTARRIAGDGIALAALLHPDLEAGRLTPVAIDDAVLADQIFKKIKALSLETSGHLWSLRPDAPEPRPD